MRLLRVLLRGAVTARHVLGVRDGLEMIGIHAEGVAAQMVEFEAIRNRADEEFVADAVCEPCPLEGAVAALIRAGGPDPAAERMANDDLGPEPFVAARWFGWLPSRSASALVAGRAHAMGLVRPSAAITAPGVVAAHSLAIVRLTHLASVQ